MTSGFNSTPMDKLKIKDGVQFKGDVKCTLLDLNGNVVEVKEYHNVVTSAFKNALAGLMNNEAPFTGIVNYGAIGTGTASPSSSDTVLDTELARTTVYERSRSSNVVSLQFYFDPTQGNGTLKEFGAFVDGTSTVDTGTLFDRVAIDVVKTSLNSLLIELTITIL